MSNALFSTSSRVARLLAAAAASMLAACGGGVSAPTSPVVDAASITILPDAAVMYSGLPTTFILSGGTGSYIVASSNQAILQVSGGVTGRSVTLIPNPVASDTVVTLTARDTGSATPVTATVTVKPGTVGNNVTITPTSTQSAACGAAVCSGGDAEVKVTISQGGVPLAARGVRFEAASGAFRIITSASGVQPEVTATSGTTTTDELGVARMRIRVQADANAQTALLQITDLATGAYQRTSFTIAPASNAPLDAQPTTIAFTGPDTASCASGIRADVIVFGGRPPYTISQPGTVAISPTTVITSGGSFSVVASGQCTAGSPVAVVDANGATVSINVTNVLGTATVTPPLIVAPADGIVLTSCTDRASVIVAGGLGTYSAASGSGYLGVDKDGSTVTVFRKPATTVPAGTTTGTVFVTDGQTVRTVTVNLIGAAAGTCP